MKGLESIWIKWISSCSVWLHRQREMIVLKIVTERLPQCKGRSQGRQLWSTNLWSSKDHCGWRKGGELKYKFLENRRPSKYERISCELLLGWKVSWGATEKQIKIKTSGIWVLQIDSQNWEVIERVESTKICF